MDITRFNALLNEIIFRKISDIARPIALQQIQRKYMMLNVDFQNLGHTYKIPDKIAIHINDKEITLNDIQLEYDNLLHEEIYIQTDKFIQKLINL